MKAKQNRPSKEANDDIRWAEEMKGVLVRQVTAIPEGFLSRKHIEKLWNLKTARTGALLREGVVSGAIETKKFLTRDEHGSTRWVPFYRIKSRV